MTYRTQTRKWILKIVFCILFFNSPLLISEGFTANFSSTSPPTNKVSTATQQSSALSNFDLFITNRYWFSPQSVDNYLSNEITLNYNFSNQFSLSVVAEYDLMTSTKNANNSDFQDTDLRFNYKYAPSNQNGLNWDGGGSLLSSIPTSRSSQNQNEYAGVGLKAFFDVMPGSFVFTATSRFYEYFYEDYYIPASNPQAADKSEPDNQVPSLPPTFETNPLTPTTSYIANANTYSDSSLIMVFKASENFMLRNELRYESYGYYDGHNSTLFHDKYGIGYKFAPEFVVWVSNDAVKNPDLPGSIFDSKYTTTIMSLYWKI